MDLSGQATAYKRYALLIQIHGSRFRVSGTKLQESVMAHLGGRGPKPRFSDPSSIMLCPGGSSGQRCTPSPVLHFHRPGLLRGMIVMPSGRHLWKSSAGCLAHSTCSGNGNYYRCFISPLPGAKIKAPISPLTLALPPDLPSPPNREKLLV